MLYFKVAFDIGMNPAIHISISFFLFFFSFSSPLCSSDGENGADEKRKAGKSPAVLLQTPTREMECFDDRKKVDVAR